MPSLYMQLVDAPLAQVLEHCRKIDLAVRIGQVDHRGSTGLQGGLLGFVVGGRVDITIAPFH
ncbi:hypothetical protein D3C72_2395700 [compost metagenome]